MVNANHYDVIIIGTGAGGGTLAYKLAPSGKRILLLERGDYLTRERANWNSVSVFLENRYLAKETWYDEDGKPFTPSLHYFVGGNTKVYGAQLFRLREQDFEEIREVDGISPAWPLRYADFEPYYTDAERLFHVHGLRGEDPTEPPASGPYPYPPVSHEPRIQKLVDDLSRLGYHPFHGPLGILLDEDDQGKATHTSPCIRCDRFDGFPCLLQAKADAEVLCVKPALQHSNVTLLTNAYVSKLSTDAGGRTVSAVHVERNGQQEEYSADIVVAACGAINSALLLFRSANDQHPNGLANSSDQVGRNYIRHNNLAMMALSKDPNPTVFQKTFALSDFYAASKAWEYPMGMIMMTGKTDDDIIRAEAPHWSSWAPEISFEEIAHHSVDFWLGTEDLPDPNNRFTLDRDGRVRAYLKPKNMEASRRLQAQLESMLGDIGMHPHLLPRRLYLSKVMDISATPHQAGTLRFGTDPHSSVLDTNCKAHDLENLYVVDSGFMPSIGAVNPALTIVANALRVGDHLLERLGAAPTARSGTATS
jgi:choline dehydrogenase-like flavoprotein